MWVHKFGVYPGCNHIVNLPLIFLVSVVLAACMILATLVTLLADMVEVAGPDLVVILSMLAVLGGGSSLV